MKRNYGLLLLVALLGILPMQAQYVKNGSFEEGLKNWKYTNLESKDNKSFELLDGELFIERWVSSANQVGSFNLEQTITDLPMGEYTLTLAAQNIRQSAADTEQTGAWIFADNYTKSVWKAADYSITLVAFGGTLTVGYRGDGATGNWVACDNVRLELTSTAPENIRAGFLKEVEALEAYLSSPMYDEDKAALEEAIRQGRQLYESGSLEGMAECVAMMRQAAEEAKNAIRDYEADNADWDKPFDATSYVVNPSFENGTTGWSIKSLTRQNNGNFKMTDGSWYLDKWNSSSAAGSFSLEQTVTGLPVGEYTLTIAAHNTKQSDAATKQTGAWIFANEVKTTVQELNDYTAKAVVVNGELTIGFKGENATGNWVACDNVRLMRTSVDLEVLRPAFLKEIEALEVYLDIPMYDEDKAKVQACVEAARTLYEENTVVGMNRMVRRIVQTIRETEAAIHQYNLDHATPDSPYDVSSYIVNPSFEDGTTGWVSQGMSTQSNSVFSVKKGNNYLEAWTSAGNRISDASVMQTLSGLPRGKYRLAAAALHIQQSGSGSITNKGAAQTGASLFAGHAQTTVTDMKRYSVEFSIVDDMGEVEIGVKAENPTGNYLCADDFTLEYIGAVGQTDFAAEVKALVAEAEKYTARSVQATVKRVLEEAIAAAQTALEGTGTDEAGNVVYDMEALASAHTQLQAALDAAMASNLLYDALQQSIDYANKVIGWWTDEPTKADAIAVLSDSLAAAQTHLTDYTLTTEQLQAATNCVVRMTSTVDKGVYCSGSACGSKDKLEDDNNHWSFKRSLQSKHWVIFWEKDYGTQVPANVEKMLQMADECFELYANQLGFITTNKGTSKTDKYKMIIRLYSTSEWKAEGSGIDNQIGMLSLSRWAYNSRGGQTVAHEIGHCFQYQVHCDNGDWRGWMFNWGQSTQNPFWEMCAQWMAYVYLPNKLFNDNEWLGNSLNGMHRHPMAGYLRYENMFIQNWFVEKHGWDAVGRLWNDCDYGEDPFQTYMRTRMEGTKEEKINQLADEMWEWGARMTTYDFESIRELGKNSINKRKQTALTKQSAGFWSPTKADCIENYGNNAIQLNVPAAGRTVYAEFVGQAGREGYTAHNVTKAGWKYGFVALLKDGTRVYSPITTSTYADSTGIASFEAPANVKNLWFVVSGAPTSYWSRDLINWVESTAEQWPYRVKFYQTNVSGNTNNYGTPTGICMPTADRVPEAPACVYSVTGTLLRQGTTSLEGLPHGVYIVNGRKVIK